MRRLCGKGTTDAGGSPMAMIMYDDLRKTASRTALRDFLERTYHAGTRTIGWNEEASAAIKVRSRERHDATVRRIPTYLAVERGVFHNLLLNLDSRPAEIKPSTEEYL
jgi:hypothetical protein